MLGVVVDQMGNPALAAQLISKAISINPSDPSAHYNLGGAQKQLKQFEAALVSFNNAISLDRKYAAAHFNRGYILAVLMNLDDALLSYDKALDLNPELLDVHWNKSHIFLLQGDFKRGWKFLNRVGIIGAEVISVISHRHFGWVQSPWPVNPYSCTLSRAWVIPSSFVATLGWSAI